MNLIPGILKPYIGICKHLPVYSTICRYVFGFRFSPENSRRPGRGGTKVRTAFQESSHNRCRGLQMPPALDRRAQFGLVPGDPNADELAVVAARFARATRPRDVLDNQLCGLDASPGRSVVSIADADQPIAITGQQLFRACHPRTP